MDETFQSSSCATFPPCREGFAFVPSRYGLIFAKGASMCISADLEPCSLSPPPVRPAFALTDCARRCHRRFVRPRASHRPHQQACRRRGAATAHSIRALGQQKQTHTDPEGHARVLAGRKHRRARVCVRARTHTHTHVQKCVLTHATPGYVDVTVGRRRRWMRVDEDWWWPSLINRSGLETCAVYTHNVKNG